MSIPSVEPLYVTSLEEVLWGGLLVAITMAMHGFGMMAVLRVNHTVKNWFKNKTSLLAGLFPVILASWMIMLVHLIEVGVWAGFFLWKSAFPNRSVAYYFSLNEYTTVGSPFNLPLHWRLLEGMIATAGLLTFAWSTGILITLAQEFQDQRVQLFKQRHGPNEQK
jgi:hypothetical protein